MKLSVDVGYFKLFEAGMRYVLWISFVGELKLAAY
jgi:hypothetical protein